MDWAILEIIPHIHISNNVCYIMSEKDESEKENIGAEQEEMKEEQHELDLKENYESDEEYEESKD